VSTTRYGIIRHALIAAVVFAAASITPADRALAENKDCDGSEAIRLVNGKIHTMDPHDAVVSSVLIRNGRFAEVGHGSSGDGRCTKVIDLHGQTALPGVIDVHNHIILLGLRPGHDTRLENADSIQEALDTLVARAAGVPNGEWITSIGGFSRNQFFLKDGVARFPTLAELDKAVPNHPVLLFEGFTGPAATNTLGKSFFESHGITVAADGGIAAAPFGGTGPSLDALFELRKLQTFDEEKRGLIDAMTYAASVGITTHLDQGGFPYPDTGVDRTDGAADFDRYRAHDSLQALYHEGKLTNRIWVNFLHLELDPETPELAARLLNVFPNFGDDMVRVLGIGEFDAGPFLLTGTPQWNHATLLVARAGWHNENHSIFPGDFIPIIDGWKAVNDQLISEGKPDGITKLRWVVAHVPFITPEYLQKLKDLGGGVNVLGGWRWLTGTATSNGPPFRTILQSGIHVGMSSDGMQISTMSPWINLYYVVTGRNARGELINDGQQLTREEGIRLYTAANGWFLNAEDKLGTIEEGKYADLIVLDKNYFDRRAVPDEEIKNLHSVLTIVNGKVVLDDLDGHGKKYWDRRWRRDHRLEWFR
jgi:predicted amidohydrolase YtcJ